MTLHEAIIQVFNDTGKEQMTTQEIADILNENNLYEKKDGSEITAFQIHGRTRNYGHLFDRDGSTVKLAQ
jgi:Ca2+-binding EF-hand superfamily protein